MIWFLYALLSAIFLSLSEIFQKRGLFKEHALEFCLTKYTFSLILLLLLLPFIDFNLPLKAWILIIIATFIGAIGNLYRAKAYKHMRISSVAPFFNISPAIVMVLAFFILGEQITGRQVTGIIILIVGAYILEVDHNLHSLTQPFKNIIKSKYIHYIFFVLIIFGFGALIDKNLITNYLDPLQFLFLASFFVTLNYLIMAFFKGGINGIKNSFKKGKKDAFFSALFWVVELFFYFKAISIQLISLVIPIKRLSTIFTTIGGGTIFKDKGLYLKAAACVVMFIGAYFVIS